MKNIALIILAVVTLDQRCLSEYAVFIRGSSVVLSPAFTTHIPVVDGVNRGIIKADAIEFIQAAPGELPVSTYLKDIPGYEEISYEQALAETQGVRDMLISNVISIAEYYGIVGTPIDWFAVDAAIEAAAQSEDDLVAMRAIKDGIRLNKNALFLKEWGVDLFEVGVSGVQ